MNDNTAGYDIQSASKQRYPWFLFAFITMVFLLSDSPWLMSIDRNDVRSMRTVSTVETKASEVEEGNSSRRLLYPILGLYGSISLIIRRSGRAKVAGLLGCIMVTFAIWAFLSVGWSEHSYLTARRIISFLLFCIAALAISSRLSPRKITSLFIFGSFVYMLYAFVWEVYFGVLRPLSAGYRFQGPLGHNLEAMFCSVLVLAGLALGDSTRYHQKFAYLASLIGFGLLILTRSRTSFASVIIAALAYRLLVGRTRRNVTVAFLVVIVLSGSFLLLGERAGSGIGEGIQLGRGGEDLDTLNGRKWLWMECRGYASEHKLIGYGFGGFWTPERIRAISKTQGWALESAHSVYVDVLLELGLIGLVFFVTLLVLAILKARSEFRRTGDNGYGFFFSFLVYFAIQGAMESMFVRPGFISFLSLIVFAKLGFAATDRELIAEGSSEE